MRSALAVGVGIVTFAAVIAVTVATRAGTDLARVVVWAGGLFALAGALCSARAVAVAAGGAATLIGLAATGIAFAGNPAWAGALLAAIAVGTAAGALARRGGRRAAAAVGVLALVLGVGARWGVPWLVTGVAIERTSRPVPELALTACDGAPLASTRGRVAVLALWATWCEPCRDELAALAPLYARYRGDARVALLAVNVGDSLDEARAFAGDAAWDVPCAHSAEGEAARSLDVGGLPAIALLDRARRLRVVHRGYDRSEALAEVIRAEVDRLLAE